MLLSEFKEYLAYGELSQLSIGDLIGDTTHNPKIISAINLGNSKLYERFPIKLNEITIQLQEEQTQYLIHSSKARSNMPDGSNPSEYYVVDSTYYPFTDDLVLIEAIFNEAGEEIPLNDENNEYSVFTTGYNTLNHPYPNSDNAILVQYRASPIKLELDSADTVDIETPNQFTEALVNYVAYRMFAGINMNSPEAISYYAKYEASCNMITSLGLWHKPSYTNIRLENAGWL